MKQPEPVKRPICPICRRPQRTCICEWIRPTENAVELLILQHPLEVDNAKGSVRLLNLSLPRSQVMVGETFAAAELKARLQAPLANPAAPLYNILLYPESPEDPGLPLTMPPLLDQALLQEPAQLRLIVLDGTWRKSRKMLYLNPLLQQLPRLALRDLPPSRYLIRKAHTPGQLSTLEATCHALMQLERLPEKYLPLLDGFSGFVAQQAAYGRSLPGP
ncbi:tRNA-uridine aminocarboxypropyltransferase [Collimonas sp.]|jgi:DTW domain-containing protein YfiP|uniref:tRNA-uridine aminocarboxypropyltransferase n=1 Tax=Collimonas sp. TaxID=1963772 RepID=UPI0037BFF7A0